tara:strand:+ start:7438 stop:8214 length:777 start_codon:yes stop_codon:yes gene_type:complete
MNYIYVYLGKVPEYMNDSIKSVKRIDPAANIIQVTDDNLNDIISDQTRQVMKLSNPLFNKADGRLWSTSLYRCFLLRDAAKFYNVGDYVHFDSDVILYQPFENVKHLFDNNRINITFDEEHSAVFGYSYFPHTILNDWLCEHLFKSFVEENYRNKLAPTFPNEMRLIGGIARELDFINRLTTIPNEKSDYVFDPSSYGQYFGGTNRHPPGWFGEHHLIGKEISNGKLKPIMKENKPYVNEVPIINLHIHSKKTKDYVS